MLPTFNGPFFVVMWPLGVISQFNSTRFQLISTASFVITWRLLRLSFEPIRGGKSSIPIFWLIEFQNARNGLSRQRQCFILDMIDAPNRDFTCEINQQTNAEASKIANSFWPDSKLLMLWLTRRWHRWVHTSSKLENSFRRWNGGNN